MGLWCGEVWGIYKPIKVVTTLDHTASLLQDNYRAMYTVNFRLLVREKAKINRSHKRVFNGLVVDIYTMWFNSIVPPLHGFCVCMDVSMTSNLKFTVQCIASWLSMCKVEF